MLTLHAPPLRLGRIERPAAAHRLVLRIRGPRVVLRERFSRLTMREFMRVIGVPANAGVQYVHELHLQTSTRPPAGSPGMTPTATVLRSVTHTVARETRRIERLHVQTVGERIRVEHAPERSRAAAPVRRRSVAAHTRAPVRLAPSAEAAPTAHASQPPAATSAPIGLVVAADPALPTPTPLAAPPRSPSVEEIAERVLRLIERRARAQRERLGRL
jgi:hypothetical protein